MPSANFIICSFEGVKIPRVHCIIVKSLYGMESVTPNHHIVLMETLRPINTDHTNHITSFVLNSKKFASCTASDVPVWDEQGMLNDSWKECPEAIILHHEYLKHKACEKNTFWSMDNEDTSYTITYDGTLRHLEISKHLIAISKENQNLRALVKDKDAEIAALKLSLSQITDSVTSGVGGKRRRG